MLWCLFAAYIRIMKRTNALYAMIQTQSLQFFTLNISPPFYPIKKSGLTFVKPPYYKTFVLVARRRLELLTSGL